MSRDWLLYLGDLIESGEKIERFGSGRTFETFLFDEAIFDAVLFNLQVIGEATKKLPAEARSALTEAGGRDPRGCATYRASLLRAGCRDLLEVRPHTSRNAASGAGTAEQDPAG